MGPLRFRESERSGSTRQDDGERWRRIRCPKCKWQPGRKDRWMCKCEHVWNTFDTQGVCPACAYAWHDTVCLRCHEWSPHASWYVDADPT